jgi:hypothetical protein
MFSHSVIQEATQAEKTIYRYIDDKNVFHLMKETFLG